MSFIALMWKHQKRIFQPHYSLFIALLKTWLFREFSCIGSLAINQRFNSTTLKWSCYDKCRDGTGLTLLGGATTSGNFPDWGIVPPRYEIRGFYQRVDNSPILNTAKVGSVIPIRFELFDGAGTTEYTTVSAMSYQISQVQCPSSAVTDAIETTMTGSTSLQYDGQTGQYLLKWQTPKGQGGSCYDVVVMPFDDPNIKAVAHCKMS